MKTPINWMELQKRGGIYVKEIRTGYLPEGDQVTKPESWKESERLNQQECMKEEIIFPMDEMLLSITTKLNEKEMLFSTIYFAGEKGERSTWWGNYNQEYIVFTDRKDM